MTDKIEVWCVVTEDDVMSVRLVTMTRLPREYGGSLVFEEWKADGGVRVQCTAETEADAREWLAEHIRMQLGHAAEAVAGQVRWLGEWTADGEVWVRSFVGRHKHGMISGEATASDDTAKKDAERRVAEMFGVEVAT